MRTLIQLRDDLSQGKRTAWLGLGTVFGVQLHQSNHTSSCQVVTCICHYYCGDACAAARVISTISVFTIFLSSAGLQTTTPSLFAKVHAAIQASDSIHLARA